MSARDAKPPIMPPAIAPVLDDCLEDIVGESGVGGPGLLLPVLDVSFTSGMEATRWRTVSCGAAEDVCAGAV